MFTFLNIMSNDQQSIIEKQGVHSKIITDFNDDLIAKSMMANDLVKEGWQICFEPSEDNDKRILIKFTRLWET